MAEGVRSTQIEQASMVDEVLANVTVDGIAKTARMPVAALGAQIAQSAGAIVAKQVKATLPQLDAIKGTMGEGDVGLVVFDPVLANRGQYALESGVLVRKADLTETQSEYWASQSKLNADRVDLGALDQAVTDARVAVSDVEAVRQTFIEMEQAAFAARLHYAGWTMLDAVTGAAGDAAEVLPSDSGTHTGYSLGSDSPVAGLPNQGVYLWSVPLSDWRRVYDSTVVLHPVEYGAFIKVSTGDIVEGQYLLSPSAPSTGHVDSLFAKIMDGTGTAKVWVLADGIIVAGPVILTGSTTVTSTISAIIAAGAEVAVLVADISDCTGLWVQVSGGN